MKQFFEQYGGIALGILALLVLIAMITPVGNIIKTSLQGTAQTFSTRIEEQQADTIDIDMGRFSNTKMPVNMLNNGTGVIFDTSYGVSNYDFETNTYTIEKSVYDGTTSYNYGLAFRNISYAENNVYLLVFDFKSDSNRGVYWEFPGYLNFSSSELEMGDYNETGVWKRYSTLIKARVTSTGTVILKQFNNSVHETRQYKNVQLYNLTDLYGAGNEPTTKEQAMEELYL